MKPIPKNPKPMMSASKPDLRKIADHIAQSHEASAFSDEKTLSNWIFNELEKTWGLATKVEEDRITKFCRKEGWID